MAHSDLLQDFQQNIEAFVRDLQSQVPQATTKVMFRAAVWTLSRLHERTSRKSNRKGWLLERVEKRLFFSFFFFFWTVRSLFEISWYLGTIGEISSNWRLGWFFLELLIPKIAHWKSSNTRPSQVSKPASDRNFWSNSTAPEVATVAGSLIPTWWEI